MLPTVCRATTTSHAGDGAFEVGPPIGVLRIDEALTQVRRVLQAFLQPVRQFVNVVDRAVAHVVMAHSSSRGMWSDNISLRHGRKLFKTAQARNGQLMLMTRRAWTRTRVGLPEPSS